MSATQLPIHLSKHREGHRPLPYLFFMIVFAGFTPHSPLLLEEINPQRLKDVEKTRSAMQELSEELYASHPDTIILISEHPTTYDDTFSLYLDDPFSFDLSEFGSFDFDLSFRPSIAIIDRLQRHLRQQGQPVTLETEAALHYASAVPLKLLTNELKNVRLVSIGISRLGAKEHFAFGQAIKDTLMMTGERVALIASGDLAHALASDGPVPLHPDGKRYDEKIQEIVSQNSPAGLLAMDQPMIENAQETSYLPLCILYGALERVSLTPKILSYEAPFGVGYLVSHLLPS